MRDVSHGDYENYERYDGYRVTVVTEVTRVMDGSASYGNSGGYEDLLQVEIYPIFSIPYELRCLLHTVCMSTHTCLVRPGQAI